MDKILVLGATGRIGRLVADDLLQRKAGDLKLYVRSPENVEHALACSAHVIKGDVLDTDALAQAAEGCDWVIACLAGDPLPQAQSIVKACESHGVGRIVWITGLGVQGEVPGPEGKMFAGYARRQPDYVEAARIVDDSTVPSLLVRAPILTDGVERPYVIHRVGARLPGSTASRATVARFITDCVTGTVPLKRNESLGVIER